MNNPDISKVIPEIAEVAIVRANGDRMKAWSEYICATFRMTGSIILSCDAWDFYAYYDKKIKGVYEDEK